MWKAEHKISGRFFLWHIWKNVKEELVVMYNVLIACHRLGILVTRAHVDPKDPVVCLVWKDYADPLGLVVCKVNEELQGCRAVRAQL